MESVTLIRVPPQGNTKSAKKVPPDTNLRRKSPKKTYQNKGRKHTNWFYMMLCHKIYHMIYIYTPLLYDRN